MTNEYSNTFRRLDKIKATMEALHAENLALRSRLSRRDETLVAKVRRLGADVSTMNTQAAARERVLQALQKKLDVYEKEIKIDEE